MIKVLVVDDLNLVRLGLNSLLATLPEIEVVASASSGEQAISMVKQNDEIEVILMDVTMPGMGGVEATRRILRIKPDIKILLMTAQKVDSYPTQLLQSGASGYVTKNARVEELLSAITTIYSGQPFLGTDIAQSIALKHLSKSQISPLEKLTKRELQILMMIAHAQNVEEIAKKLCLSKKTVHSYRYRIFEKLGVESDVMLTHLAIRHELVELVH